MVRRRRTRATNKTEAAEKSVDEDNDQRHVFHGPNAVAITLPKDALLDEQYFASPKRKDCRIDCGKVFETCCNQTDDQVYSELKSNQHSDCKIKSERGGIYGRNIGVPLATRSQTRTIEHFFKANTASKSDNLKNRSTDKQNIQNEQHAPANSSNITNKVDIVSFKIRTQSLPNEQCDKSTMLPQRHLSIDDKDLQLQPHLFLDISEDTNDTENTGISEYSTPQNTNFGSYRSSLRDSHSSQSSTTDNIFLQEPVLTLNVDKSPNQASSIKINKTLEIEPIFSSPPTITAVVLNGHFNRIVSMNGSPEKREDLETTTNIIVLDSCFDLQLENDSSSCDSGVAFGRSILETGNIENPLTAASRRRKPATPHRIVCPSPIKVAPRNVSPSNLTLMGQTSLLPPRNIQTLKEQLSPRKSNRYMSATVPKTRRRLHQPKEHQAPYKSSTHQNEYKQENDIQEVQHNIRNEPDKHMDNENLEDATVPFFSVPSKMVSTSQLNKGHKTKNVTTKQQIQAHQPKMKLHQLPQPLAATNGNRELSEFFPVRRSVRKTKTEVKEEIMRNIEKAISEERADGLKIAHFKNKGRGVVADRRFERGEFVVEYVGDLISMTEAAEREKMYALDENAGCYMYYFKHKNQQYCIDATIDTGKLGRLVNHSRNGNLSTKVVVVKQKPHLILLAKDDIEQGEELTYDYGDRSKESLLHHPWLAF